MEKSTLNKILVNHQEGKATPREQMLLYKELEKHYRPHKMENHIYDSEELKNEFMCHSFNALGRAKLTVGDPIMFAVNRGRGAMLDYYRKVSSEKLLYVCTDCGHKMTYDRRNDHCKLCGCEELASIEKEEYADFERTICTYKDEYEAIEEDLYVNQVISYIRKIDELSLTDKKIIISAIQDREEIYAHARKMGKSYRSAKSLSERIKSFFTEHVDMFVCL